MELVRLEFALYITALYNYIFDLTARITVMPTAFRFR